MNLIRIFANFQRVLRYFKIENILAKAQHTNQRFTYVIAHKQHTLWHKKHQNKNLANGPCNPIVVVAWTQGSIQPPQLKRTDIRGGCYRPTQHFAVSVT